MIERTGQSIRFPAFFSANKQGKTGLTISVTVYKPDNSVLVTGAASELADGYYTFSVSGASVDQIGDYVAIFKTTDTSVDQQVIPSEMCVGRGGLNNLDSTVSSRLASSSYTAPPSAASIASAVWANGTRTLSSFGTLASDVATAVWANGTRTLSGFGTLIADIWNNGTRSLTDKVGFELSSTGVSAIATSVWAAGTRSLTTFGTLVSDIWSNGSRTLSGFGSLVSDTATAVWNAGTRSLTDRSNFGLSSATITNIKNGVLDEVVDSSHHAGASTVGQLIFAAGASSDPLINAVPGTYPAGSAGAILGKIATGGVIVSVVQPVQTQNSVQLVEGDDYYASDNRAVEFTSSQWPDLTGAGVKIGFAKKDGGVEVIDGTVVVPSGDTKQVRFELPAAKTSGIKTGSFEVQAVLSNDHVITLLQGTANVLSDVIDNS